jgi:hypothetical protein
MAANPRVVFAIASAAVFLVSVDATIAVAAFPALRSSFAETSPATLSWVLNADAILNAALLVPARRLPALKGADAGEGLDVPGIALIVGGVVALTYGMVQIKAVGLAAATVWGPALAGLGLLTTYALWARGRKGAAIEMTLFADRTYALVTLASLVFGIAFSLMFLSSFLFLLGIWGYAQGLTGLAVTPGPLVVIAVAIASGRLAAQDGHRAVLVMGGILYAVAQGWVALHVTETPAYLTLGFPMQIVGGIAVGLLLVGLSGAAVAHLPPERFGVGGAVNTAVRQLGGVLGTALAVVLVGQTGAGLEAFRFAFLCLGLIGLAIAVLCLPLPRQSGRFVPRTAG